MTHFLRDSDNRTIVDIESTNTDLRVVINIREYSQLLLMIDPANQTEFVDDFSNVQNLRGIWFENLSLNQSSREFAQLTLARLALKYNLNYLVD